MSFTFYLCLGIGLVLMFGLFVWIVNRELDEHVKQVEQDPEVIRRREWDAKWNEPSTDNGDRSRNWFTRRK
jgi:hypothetical protein